MSLRAIYITLSQASILLPIFSGLINYKRLTRPFRILFYFFLASIVFEVQASVLIRLYHNNMPGLHLFTIVEFLTFSTVFYLFFRQNRLLSVLIGINMIIFTIAALADALFIHNIWMINTLGRSYASATMLCYCLIYLYFMFSTDEPRYSARYPMFWVNAGMMIYFGANVLYFMFNKDLLVRSPFTEKLGLYIHAGLNIVANYLYAQSFKCFKQKTVS